jgi:ABC-2 type transport system ATP-binding protein
MDTFAITTAHLTRRFGNARAVDDLTLDIPRGIVFGFLGPNGSGKTTTIRLLLGLIEPSAGEAVVLGHDVRTAARDVRSRTGVLLEHTGLYERLSAEANLDYYARIAQLGEADRQARVREMLTQIGLWDRRAQPIRDWSRGMKQRLAVARALIHRPELVFLDEPTAGLDPVAAAGFRDDLVEMVRRDGTTVFLTTHNLTEAERLCQQVGVIRAGRLLAAGRTDELVRRSRQQSVVSFAGRGLDDGIAAMLRARPEVQGVRRLGSTLHVELRTGADASPLVAAIVNAGAEVEEVRKARATLEDLFLDLVDDTNAAAPHVAREMTTC